MSLPETSVHMLSVQTVKFNSWGSNIYGQLGNGQYGGNEIENNGYDSDVVYATEISIDADGNDFSNIIKIAAGISHVLALKNDGSYMFGEQMEIRCL